jgi:hypothetical protein
MILMMTKRVWSTTQGILMTIISQRGFYQRRHSAVVIPPSSCSDLGTEGDEFLVRSTQAFRGERTLPVGVELPKASTHLKVLEKLH